VLQCSLHQLKVLKMGPTIQVRLPDELKAALQARADAEGRTLSNLIRRILEQAMKEQA